MGNYVFTEDDHSSDDSPSSSWSSSSSSSWSSSSSASSSLSSEQPEWQQSDSTDIEVSTEISSQSTNSGDDGSSSWSRITQHSVDSEDSSSNSTSSTSFDSWESSQSTSSADEGSTSWSRITEHEIDTDEPKSAATTDSEAGTEGSSDTGGDLDWSQSQVTSSSYDHDAATLDEISSQIDDYEDGWPVNENGEYLVIDVTIRPTADIDLTTIFGVTADANGPENALDFDTFVDQLAKVSEDTYIEVDYYWGSKPDLIVTLEPDFNIDSDVFARINFDADDVVLDSLLDIVQTAIPTSDAAVVVDFDPDDSDNDGHLFDIDVDVDLSVLVDQGLDAYVDATLPG